MKKYFYLLELILLSCTGLKAQNVINTDRPDQSDGSHIVEKNYLQLETGLQFSKLDDVTTGFDNVTMIRYGITRKFEIRLLNQYSIVRSNKMISGIKPLTISFKNQLCKQHGILPKITLVSYFRLPFTISPAFSADRFGYTFTLALRHDLLSNLKIYSNFGVTKDQQSKDISYLGTVELNYNVTISLSAFIEYYGNYAVHTYASNGVDIGFIYALKNNFAIDLAFGSPTLNIGLNNFISTGISIRLPK
jgi:hypothetical protein